uniref:Receptor-type tyrosine-protein phosphatase kappa n=1 Tax=Magallana gigas TaxID=29159 RepID=K1QCY5_MAGGI
MTDSYDAAVDPKNKYRNRYKNVYPYDFSRVVLDTSDIAGSGDYINACFVHMKCLRYWPNTETRIGPFFIRTENHNTSRRYTIRHITIRKGIEVRHVTQYQYTDWLTTRVPANVDSILMFRNLINCDISDTDGPIIIHCSSGTGRTGTFIALDYLLTEGTETGTVDVEGCIRALREQRAYAVQSSVNNRTLTLSLSLSLSLSGINLIPRSLFLSFISRIAFLG